MCLFLFGSTLLCHLACLLGMCSTGRAHNFHSFLAHFPQQPRGSSISFISSPQQLSQIRHILFTITADQDKGVKETIKAIKEWRPYQGDREVGETIHTMNGTREAFRLIVLRWPKLQAELFDPSPYFYHAIATNREETAEETVSYTHLTLPTKA